LRNVDQAAGGVRRPDPADVGLFEIVEDGEAAVTVMRRYERRLGRFGGNLCRCTALKAPQQTSDHFARIHFARAKTVRRASIACLALVYFSLTRFLPPRLTQPS